VGSLAGIRNYRPPSRPEESNAADFPRLLRLGGKRRGDGTAQQGQEESAPVHYSIT
jgi:hypothetical protein